MKEPQNHIVTLHPAGVNAPLLNIISESSNNVLFGLQLIDSVETPIAPFDIQSEDVFFALYFKDPHQVQDTVASKTHFKLWLLKKGFEDLIKGISLSLIEAYFFTSIVSKHKDLKTPQQLHEETERIRKKASKLHLPELFKRIKPFLTSDLSYESQILSLNQVRNCLVHRNGLVTEFDINNQVQNQLQVNFSRMKMTYNVDDTSLEIQKFSPFKAGTVFSFGISQEVRVFEIGETVTFNFQEFNHLVTTCFLFGQDLVSKLPTIE